MKCLDVFNGAFCSSLYRFCQFVMGILVLFFIIILNFSFALQMFTIQKLKITAQMMTEKTKKKKLHFPHKTLMNCKFSGVRCWNILQNCLDQWEYGSSREYWTLTCFEWILTMRKLGLHCVSMYENCIPTVWTMYLILIRPYVAHSKTLEIHYYAHSSESMANTFSSKKLIHFSLRWIFFDMCTQNKTNNLYMFIDETWNVHAI